MDPMSEPTPLPAAAWSRVARTVIAQAYPWSPGHLVTGPEDAHLVPEILHPAFHGSLDWHSCVHMQWSLVVLLTRHPAELGEAEREAAIALLDERLRPEHVAVEVAYLRARPSFERPYGWAWALQLVAEVTHAASLPAHAGQVPALTRWAAALAPLGDMIPDLVLAWLPRQAYPVRHGKHQNDAFALRLLLDAARRLGRADLAEAVRQRALVWFAADTAAPTAWEPSGTDFLSPALTEAGLLAQVLDPERYAGWLAAFLPGLGEGEHEHLLAPPQVDDPTDGQYAHLLGLALSRAWQLRELAQHLPAAAARLRRAADEQESAVLPEITDGDFMATHWLVSFALLARGALGGADVAAR